MAESEEPKHCKTLNEQTETTKSIEKMENENERVHGVEPIDQLGGSNSECEENQLTSSFPSLANEEMSTMSENGNTNKALEDLGETINPTVYTKEETNINGNQCKEANQGVIEEEDLAKEIVHTVPRNAESGISYKWDKSIESFEEERDETNVDPQSTEFPSSITYGISETELSNVLDKLTNEQDIVDNISPVVSDFEKEMEAKDDISRETSESPKLQSEDSGTEDECSSVDSDISGDEEVCGTWNPSPLYSFDVGEEGDDEEKEILDDMCENEKEMINTGSESQEGENAIEGIGEHDDDNKLIELREDVKGLMEEMESLVRQGHIDESEPEEVMPTIELDCSDIEVIGAAATTTSSFKQTVKTRHKMDSNINEQDMPHVHFQSPTNMLFYDPESPIIERVSTEVQNELIDYDDEAKDVETEKENSGTNQAELQAEVVKDLKELYEEIEANREANENEDSNLELQSTEHQTGVESTSLSQTLDNIADPSIFNLYKRKQEDRQETQEEEEVVLRKKSNRNTNTVLNRSQIISENQCDSMIIHNTDMKLQPTELESLPVTDDAMHIDTSNMILHSAIESENDESTEMKSSTDSMIIHDDGNSLDEESDSVYQATEAEERSDLCNHGVANSMQNVDINASNVVEQIIKSADNKMKEENIQDIHGTFTDKPTVDIVHENVSTEILTEDKQMINEEEKRDLEDENICNSETESIDECSPFDVSLNDTVVEANAVTSKETNSTHRGSVENGSVSESVNLNSNEIKIDELRSMAKTANSEAVKECDEGTEDEELNQQVVLERTEEINRSETTGLVIHFIKQVLELIYWRDVKKTGVVFGSMMFILLSLSICSLMSVLAYLSLAILTVTLSFRIYKNVMQAVQKTSDGHPFKNLLQMDIELREDMVKNAADKIAKNVNNCAKELRRLYLVEDYVDTLKFGLMLWLLTYIGGWFNGMTLIILVVVSIFTLPKVYETYKVPIDQNVNLVRANLNNIMAQVSAKIPFPKKKAKTQ